ncbi:TNF receptor-associated factor 6-A-like isoform X2 [Hydra vulgaris]|uniref:TNF receptor-associated factor 6-A-like isoform X2 n=1 Tax=Hydra vulgaris TaxID=6087 RepID=UPI0032EA84B4
MESLDTQECGGYNVHFLHELLDEYECPVCKMALREPILTLCGHRLCFSCSEEIKKRNNGVLICPLDKTILSSEKVFPDKFTERAILQLKVKCDNFLKSCQWTGELKKVNVHVENCENLPLYCVKECGMKVLRKEMSFHITSICANTLIPCQYLNIGCNFKGTRKEQDTHAISSTQSHLLMAISKVVTLENKITSTMNTFEQKITSKVDALENKIMLVEKELERKRVIFKNENNHEATESRNSFPSSNSESLREIYAYENEVSDDELLINDFFDREIKKSVKQHVSGKIKNNT